MSASEMMMLEEELNELRAEVTRLRGECGQAYLQGVKAGRDAERISERAAVVDMLRDYANSWGTSTDEKRALHWAISRVQHGKHRRKEHACTMETKISKTQTAEITDQLGRKLPLSDHHKDCPHGQNGWAMCTCEELKARDIERSNRLFKELADK